MAFDERKAQRVIRFIEALKHTKGEFHGKPFELLPWQEKIIRDVFGTVRDDDPTQRQYTSAYIEIPKKNGKSELGAAIALNMLVNDDEWKAEVYSCASDRQQAAIVFDVAVDMVKQSPALMEGYAIARQNGWMSANDIRELENLNPLSEEQGGNAYLINGNMIPINLAGLNTLMGLQIAAEGGEKTTEENEEVKT